MNVFKKGRKAKDQEDAKLEVPTTSKATRSFTRKKKNIPAPKPEIDIATALPDTNDFRTSMLMPGLSARFSMLREQDDPNSKIGKASDDSVLFPKRMSRLNLFNHNPLTDIAEVESIHSSSFKPPFARGDRASSMSDGYASDDGASVMARSRPGEGNNLFGGRQKLYRMPVGSASSTTVTDGARSSGGGLGKHVYGDDVSMSLFQQYRARAREEEARAALDGAIDEPEVNDASNSQFDAFSKNRGTTSSTTSGPSNRRTSTAATSVDSESPIPRQNSGHTIATSKSRGSDLVNGVDDNAMKRNPSSESRRNFAPKDNAVQPPMPSPSGFSHQLPQSRSAVNLGDKFNRNGPFATSAFRAVSPPPLTNNQAIASLDLGLQERRTSSQARRYQTASPSSPPPGDEEADNIYSSALQPNDRGKATAMGLFNRPRQQFDEQQFLQRQRTMLEGRSSPFSTDGRADSRASPENATAGIQRLDSAQGTSAPSPAFDMPPPNTLPSPEKPVPKFTSPNKSEISARARQQSTASSTLSTSAPTNVKARVESLIRRQNAELAAMEAELEVTSRNTRQVSESSESLTQSARGTFFNNFDGSDDESEMSPPKLQRPSIASTDIHPAFRNGTNDFDFSDSASTPHIRQRQSNGSQASNAFSTKTKQSAGHGDNHDSLTLPPSGLGLSGMIRTHLRNDSDKSSVFPPSPGVGQFPRTTASREVSMASTTHTINPPESVHSDPWEFDTAVRGHKRPSVDQQMSESPPTMSQKAQQILGHAATQRSQQSSKAQRILGQEAPTVSEEKLPARTWHDELAASHKREESTDTQRERDDFDNQLAERRRKIQEKMRDATEEDIRARSPVRQERSNIPGGQVFAGLRHKTSRGNMAPPMGSDRAPKALKMLGISGPGSDMRPPQHPIGGDHDEDRGYPPAGPGWRGQQRPPPPTDSEYGSGRRTPGGSRPPPPNGYYDDFERQRQRSATPNGGRGPSRMRTGSEAADRSKSRNGRYREDEYPPMDPRAGMESRQGYRGGMESRQGNRPPMDSRQGNRSAMESRQGHRQAMESRQGMQSRQGHSPSPPHMPPMRTPEDERGPYERSPSAMSGRNRSGSRPQQPGYFDNRGQPPNSMPMPNGHRPSPRPPFPQSPVGPYAAQPSPAFGPPQSASNSAMASPVANTHGAVNDPSGRQTPTNGRATPSRDRKKSVNKTMISEPMFLSSTSSVPLVGLPGGQPMASPAIPPMNPDRQRRRAGTIGDRGTPSPFDTVSSLPGSTINSPLVATYESAPDLATAAAQHAYHQVPEQYKSKPPPRARNRLRKISSEGGNMAGRARQQAMMMDAERSPAIPHSAGMFPNRSATSLGVNGHEGGMF